MPYRMTGYVGLGIRTFEMPIYCSVNIEMKGKPGS